MPEKAKYTGFGFSPDESQHHFLVIIPAGNQRDVVISEHFTFDPETGHVPPAPGIGEQDQKLKVVLSRAKWNALADEVRVELNRRLKKQGMPMGRWKTGPNPVQRLLGKELVLLAWAVEDADPGLVPAAIKNWLGLAPEERWWLFTMTNAATGHALHGRGKGWRKAVRFALTENPVTGIAHEPTNEFFELVGQRVEEAEQPPKAKRAAPRRDAR